MAELTEIVNVKCEIQKKKWKCKVCLFKMKIIEKKMRPEDIAPLSQLLIAWLKFIRFQASVKNEKKK